MKKRVRLFALILALVAAIPIAAIPVSASSAVTPPGLLESQVGMEIQSGYPKENITIQFRNPHEDNVFYQYTPPCFLLNRLLDGTKTLKHYAVCCQNEAAAGVQKEKFSINLEAMKEDSKGWYLMEYDTRRDIKWIFKVFYYGTKLSTWEYLESQWNIKSDYQFLVAVSLAYRHEGKANKITHDQYTAGYNLNYVDATNYLIDLAAEDKDNIGGKIEVGSGIAWLETGENVYDVMCVYNPQDKNSKSQRMIVFTPDTSAEKGSITIQKKDNKGRNLQGATFQIYDAKGNVVSQFTNGITTNADGIATTGAEALDLGKYTVIETKVPEGVRTPTQAEAEKMGGYINGSGQLCFDVEISAQKNTLNVTLDVVNYENRGAIGVRKGERSDGKLTPLKNVTFGLYSEPKDDALIMTTLTSEFGSATFGYNGGEYTLEAGKLYYVKEIGVPEGYESLSEFPFYSVYCTAGKTTYCNDGVAIENTRLVIPTGVDTNVKTYSLLLFGTVALLIGAAAVCHKAKKAKKE